MSAEPWVCFRCKAVRPEDRPKDAAVWIWLPNDDKVCPECLQAGFGHWINGTLEEWAKPKA